MPNVSYIRPEVRNYADEYRKIEDCLLGETAVKKAGTRYLPKPSPEDNSKENNARYKNYLNRAVFYNVAGRTHAGLVGSVFNVTPSLKLSPAADYLRLNANGIGTGILQLAKKMLGGVIGYGRAGLFVDYPHVETDGENGVVVTMRQVIERNLRPTIELYNHDEIINWRTRVDGGVEKLSLVVLKEKYIQTDDGFEVTFGDQYRVLRLDDAGKYYQELWRGQTVYKTFRPVDAGGVAFDEIPFYFIGSLDNSPDLSPPPMFPIVSINLAHYRNSADYEESVWLVGQPTPVYSGITTGWIEQVWKTNAVQFGSRAALLLPVNGKAELLQAEPNSLAKEAMTDKENQMISLGAKLVAPKSGPQRTAYEASLEEASENSTLTGAAENCNAAFEKALTIVERFIGNTGKLELVVNTDLELSTLGAEDRKQVVAEWTANAITFGEMRAQLRRAGIATETDEKAKAEIDEDVQKAAEIFNANNNSPDDLNA